MNPRKALLVVHRYVGLVMAVFLVVAASTGTFLTFYHELDYKLGPARGYMAAESDQPALDVFTLRNRLVNQIAGIQVNHIEFPHDSKKAIMFRVSADPAADGSDEIDNDQYFLNPNTGEILGARKRGDISQGVKNLMPFLFKLHYSLALGRVGSVIFGIVALLWTVDCFVGLYLTFPARSRANSQRPLGTRINRWFSAWKPAWLLRGGRLFTTLFSWHRASGLWVWAMLLIFAWSAVGLNLKEVYAPVTRTLFTLEAPFYDLPNLKVPKNNPRLSLREARDVGRRLAEEKAEELAFKVIYERRLAYYPRKGLYRYQIKSSLDISKHYPNTTFWFDGDTGALAMFYAPTGHVSGNTITTWLYNFHFAAIWGLPHQIFVSVMGVLVVGLSISGVYIWWQKRKKRRRVNKPPALPHK